jgi:hypothetical protein
MPAFSAVDTMACLAKNFMAPKMGGVRIIQLTMRDSNWSPVAGGAATTRVTWCGTVTRDDGDTAAADGGWRGQALLFHDQVQFGSGPGS